MSKLQNHFFLLVHIKRCLNNVKRIRKIMKKVKKFLIFLCEEMMMKMEKFYNIPQLHENFSHQKCNKHNKIEKNAKE